MGPCSKEWGNYCEYDGRRVWFQAQLIDRSCILWWLLACWCVGLGPRAAGYGSLEWGGAQGWCHQQIFTKKMIWTTKYSWFRNSKVNQTFPPSRHIQVSVETNPWLDNCNIVKWQKKGVKGKGHNREHLAWLGKFVFRNVFFRSDT